MTLSRLANALLATVVLLPFSCSVAVPDTSSPATQARLISIARAFRLGHEATGALAALYKSLPQLTAGMQPNSKELTQLVADFETIGRRVNEIQSTSDYQAFLREPLVTKYNLAPMLPIWDPFFQATSVDRTEKFVEDRIAGRNTAIASFVEATTAANSAALSLVLHKLDRSILLIPDKISVDDFLADPILGKNSEFLDAARSLANGMDLSVVFKNSANSLLSNASTLVKDGVAVLQNIQAAPKNLLPPRGNFEFPKPAAEIQARVGALVALAALTGSQDFMEGAQRIARIADGAVQVYQAAQLAAGAATGMGTVSAISMLLSGGSSLAGSKQSEAGQILAALQQILDYMKKQFAIVNAKLDYIIAGLDRIENKVDNISNALAGVVKEVHSIDGRLDGLRRSISQGQLELTNTIWSAQSSECKGLAEGDAFGDPQKFVGCVGTFTEFGNSGSVFPFMIPVDDSRANVIDLLGERSADAISYSRYAATALPLISQVLQRISSNALPRIISPSEATLPCAVPQTNSAVIIKAAQYLTLMANEKPSWFSFAPPLMSNVEKLSDQLRSVQVYVRCLAGSGPNIREKRLAALVEAYRSALRDLSRLINEALSGAVTQFIADIESATAATTPTPIAPWSVVIPTSNAAAPPLSYCGQPPPATVPGGSKHNFDPEFVGQLPHYFTKGGEIGLIYLCVDEDKSSIYQGVVLGVPVRTLSVDAKIKIVAGSRPIGRIEIPKIPQSNRYYFTKHCLNIIECLSENADLKQAAYQSIKMLLNDGVVTSSARQYFRDVIIYSNDKSFRILFGHYFELYIQGQIFESALKDRLAEVDQKLALLKYFVVQTLSQSWAVNDHLRLLLDGKDTHSLFKSSTWTAIIACQSKFVCSDQNLKKEFEQNPPFWWDVGKKGPDWGESELSRLEFFYFVAVRPLEEFLRIKTFSWEPPYDPLVENAVARIDFLAHRNPRERDEKSDWPPAKADSPVPKGKAKRVILEVLTRWLFEKCVAEGTSEGVDCGENYCHAVCDGGTAQSFWNRMQSVGAETHHFADHDLRALGNSCKCKHIMATNQYVCDLSAREIEGSANDFTDCDAD